MALAALPGSGQIGGHRFHLTGKALRRGRRNDIEQRQLVDPLAVEPAISGEPFRQLAADHPSRAGDEDVHVVRSLAG